MGCGASAPAPPAGGWDGKATAPERLSEPAHLALSPQEKETVFRPGREACNEDIEDDLLGSRLPNTSFVSRHSLPGSTSSSAGNSINFKMAPFTNASVVVDLVDGGSYASATQARLLRYYIKRDLQEGGKGGDVRETRRGRAQSLQDELEAPIACILADHARVLDSHGLMTEVDKNDANAGFSRSKRASATGLSNRDTARASLPGAPGAVRASRTNRFPSMPAQPASSMVEEESVQGRGAVGGEGESFSTRS